MNGLYKQCEKIYDDYREVVPSYASAALSFYLLLLLIPTFSLIAIGASLLRIDMHFIENIIYQVIMPEYANMLIDVLKSTSINTVALVTIVISIYTVSRGVGNIYEISKRMYHQDIKEKIVGYYIYTFKITIFILLIFIGILAVLALGPLSQIFNFLYSLFAFRFIFLYSLVVFCLMSIYMIVPKIRMHHSDALKGALAASVMFLILYYGLNIYFQYADFQSVYGPLAFIVMILFVFNWAAEVFYIGMYITNILHLRRQPDENRRSRD